MKSVTIYTDGGCVPNPGKGGYGIVLICEGVRKEINGGFRKTTNNRMEMTAAIVALQQLSEPCQVLLHSDSLYLINGITKGWAKKWKRNNWMRTRKDKAINPDLWDKLLELCDFHKVEWRWVKGHSGQIENERCDFLATQAVRAGKLDADLYYETQG